MVALMVARMVARGFIRRAALRHFLSFPRRTRAVSKARKHRNRTDGGTFFTWSVNKLPPTGEGFALLQFFDIVALCSCWRADCSKAGHVLSARVPYTRAAVRAFDRGHSAPASQLAGHAADPTTTRWRGLMGRNGDGDWSPTPTREVPLRLDFS